MRKILITLLCFIAINSFAQSSKDKQAILDVLEKQRQEWNKGDVEAYMQGYAKSDSLLFVGKSGPTYGWQKTLDNYKRGYPDKSAMGFLTFGIKKVDFLTKDVAFVLGSWNVRREKDELKGFFTLLLKKINGQWKVVVDHSS
ncbi:YybH family protein [Pedobacter fastidiosus]|uniref:Nuclear transport factor 2 family protein n=1 Tax=Pedobacter fastidiosus TaxID=2765361 RepID=A0ABR7KSL6_9SPHI|nr:nuclear transport factor 2 family protein [Pedobacter fastidiosus]MBC6111089.1 nuclear transport factor 2 family protein [Pedobacter fastidiosus]